MVRQMNLEKLKQNLIDLIINSTTAFTCINYIKEILKEHNFRELEEQNIWNIEEGNYFVTRNDASLIAF